MQTITVTKLDVQGQPVISYSGQVLQRRPDRIVLEAFFNYEDRILHGMPLLRGDRFVETYYFDRWYNIYEIHSREDDRLRGWYCNIGKPAVLEDSALSYIDLALDLLVFPDGRQIVLDEEEFEHIPLSHHDREQALRALEALQNRKWNQG